MHSVNQQWQQDLVLLGGGHAHALVLLRLAMQPLPGVRVTLVSEASDSPYSGMLPGLVAGHYQRDEVHIDLRNLCRHAGVRFLHAQVAGIDPALKRVLLQGRPPLEYDKLSLNIGATPDLDVAGAQHVIPVKPITTFWPRWLQVRDQLLQADAGKTILVVGGGAGSVELALAMAHRLRASARPHRVQLVTRGEQLLPGYPALMLRWLQPRLQQYGIQVHTQFEVANVQPDGVQNAAGQFLPADAIFWCTQARAADWPGESGLAVQEKGFVRVHDTLQSVSHPDIFAAGDCAWLDPVALPRAGVYAVRQAPVLFENLRRSFLHQPLQPYRPQRRFLSLLATGDRDAVGARGAFSIAGAWVWRWKDRIDRRFMAMLQQLPVLPPPQQQDDVSLEPPAMRCGGCGGKVGADVLQQALAALNDTPDEKTGQEQCPLPARDDAALIDVCADPVAPLLVQSVDVLKPLLDDPFLFARITALHALSDLYAMHAQPHSAQLQVQLPLLHERLQIRDMQQLLQGVRQELRQAGAELLGGHTLEAETLQLGLTVNGLAQRQQVLRKGGAQAGDRLLLTKPLGSGALFAAFMRGAARADWIDAALQHLLQSNALAADVLASHQAHALTDVTGFGLLGHLLEMLDASGVGAELNLAQVPAMNGALDCIARGYRSTLSPANQRARHRVSLQTIAADDPRYTLLFDPQTSGGLLAAVPARQAQHCLEQLRAVQIPAAIIGGVLEQASVSEAAVLMRE